MIWLYIALGVLVGLPLLLGSIGLLLDRHHVAKVTFKLLQPPAVVFAVITDPQHANAWRKDLKSVEVLAPVAGRARFREHGTHGPILYEVVSSDPPRRHVVRIADEKLAFGGSWTYELEEDVGGGTHITITEDGFVKNPIFRVLSRFVFSLTATLEGYAKALGEKFGESVKPSTTLARGG